MCFPLWPFWFAVHHPTSHSSCSALLKSIFYFYKLHRECLLINRFHVSAFDIAFNCKYLSWCCKDPCHSLGAEYSFLGNLNFWWIIIQTHIRNTDSYSDTDSENLHISLSNQWFFLNVIQVSQRVANDQLLDGKTSLQKSVILPIIRSVSPT